jgi:hypothetical protein
LQHRLDGPAYKFFYKNGTLAAEEWYQNGSLHRLGGPAMRVFSFSGDIVKYVYFVNNNRHRIDGPAIEHFDLFGRCVDAEYWLNDKKITKSEHQRQAAILKLTTQVASTGGVSL